jgi:hypothetical protein
MPLDGGFMTNWSATSRFRSPPDHPHSHGRALPGRIESPHAVAAAESRPGLHRPEVTERPLLQRAMYVFRFDTHPAIAQEEPSRQCACMPFARLKRPQFRPSAQPPRSAPVHYSLQVRICPHRASGPRPGAEKAMPPQKRWGGSQGLLQPAPPNLAIAVRRVDLCRVASFPLELYSNRCRPGFVRDR